MKKKETEKDRSLKYDEMMKLLLLKIGQMLGYTCIVIGVIMTVLILTVHKF